MTKEEQIEEMAKCCTYHDNGKCCADVTYITECDLMCEMFGVLANLEMAGYRKVDEVRHGHWIEDRKTGCPMCSECGHITDEMIPVFIYSDEGKVEAFSFEYPFYCSRCGAKMDGAEAEAKIKELEEK